MLDEDFETNAVLVDRNDQLAFRVLNKVTYCGMEMWEASYGVFLVSYIEKLEKLKPDQFVRSGDTKGLEDLTLADIDFKVVKNKDLNLQTWAFG